jgi:glycosyltransferase involved in cell wall biosynthesis
MLHDYPPIRGGGLALAAADLAEVLSDTHTTEICSSRFRDHFADDRSAAPPYVRLVAGLSALWRLRSCDILISHWTFSYRWLSTAAVVIGPLLKKPTICVIHTGPTHCEYNRMRYVARPIRRLLHAWFRRHLARCDAVVALTPSHREELAVHGLLATHTIPIPLSTPLQQVMATSRCKSTLRPVTIGVGGELSRLKGVDRLPEIMRQLTPRVRFLIVGAGPLDAILRESVASMRPEQRSCVDFLGRLEPAGMGRFYASIDYLLVCSRTEAQGRMVHEAMMSGVLVLIPPVTGLADLVVHGRTGLVIDPSSPTLIESALDWLEAHPVADDAMRDRAKVSTANAVHEATVSWRALVAAISAQLDAVASAADA